MVSSFSPPKDFGPKGFLKEICRRKSYDSMNPEGPGALAKKVHQIMDSLHIDDEMAKGFMAKIGDKVESKFEQIKSKFSH